MKPLERHHRGKGTHHVGPSRDSAGKSGTSTQGSRSQRVRAKAWRRAVRKSARQAVKHMEEG